MPSRNAQKDVNEVIRLVRANKNFKIVKSGKHFKLLDAKGRAVVDEAGPVILSGSASDQRARDMHVHRLIKVGALTHDPWKPQAAEGNGSEGGERGSSRLTDPDVQAAKVAAVKRISAERIARTQRLRARLEPIIAKLGGWGTGAKNSSGVAVTELGDIGLYFATIHNRYVPWKTAQHPQSAARVSAQTLKSGGAMKDEANEVWTLVVDWLEEQARRGDEHLRKAWFEMVRDARGIPVEGRQLPAPMPPREEEQEKEEREPSLVQLVAHDQGREWAARVSLEDYGDMERTLGALDVLSHLGHITGAAVERFETVVGKIARERLKVES